MQYVLWAAAISFFLYIALPLSVYFCVKMGRFAYLQADRRFVELMKKGT